MFLLFALGALLVFAAVNLFALATFGAGFVLLMALRLRRSPFRRSEFWWLSTGASLFCGGAGALGASWGAGYAASLWWPESDWPFAAWAGGYIVGGIGGTLAGALGVALRRRAEWPGLKAGLKTPTRRAKPMAPPRMAPKCSLGRLFFSLRAVQTRGFLNRKCENPAMKSRGFRFG